MNSSPTDQQPTKAARRTLDTRVLFSRLAIVTLVLTVLALADAIYMQVTHYQASDVNNFGLSDAGTVFVATGFLALLTIVLFVLSRRTSPGRSAPPRGR